MIKILALDPGGTTGYSWVDLSGDKEEIPTFHGGQLGPHEHFIDLWQLLQANDWRFVVYEEFTYRMVAIDDKKRGNVYSPKIELVSKEYIGLIKFWTLATPQGRTIDLVPQQPSAAVGRQTFWTAEKMKKMGVYKEGKPHQNDATRHLLYYTVTKLGYKAILSLLQ